MDIKDIISNEFLSALTLRGIDSPPPMTDELILLQSGLDSLGFAILVTTLEDELGYDPFTLMEVPVYPRTFGEFVSVYLKFSDHAKK